MKKLFVLLLALTMVFALTACAGSSGEAAGGEPSGVVTVYVAHNADQYNTVIQEFQELYDIEVLAVSLGTGDALQRIAAEAENPQCDVMWGGTTESLEAYKEFFQPFVSANDEFVAEEFKDPTDLWTGESQQPSVLMYNKDLVSEDNIPTAWEDLLDSQWEGKIASANPASSGSAYTQLCTGIMATSPDSDYEAGWAYMEQLAKNLIISGGSSSVYKGVADGEYPLGLTLEQLAYVYVSADPDKCGMVYLEGGTSNVPDGFAMIKDCPNPENAKVFMDFLLSSECQQIMSDQFGRRTVRNDLEQPEALPSLDEIDFIEYDFEWAGAGKADVVSRWEQIAVNVISAG